MTLRDALAELEDRDLPEVIELIRQMDRQIEELRIENENLQGRVSDFGFGGF